MLDADLIPRHLAAFAKVTERLSDAPGVSLALRTSAGGSFRVRYATFEEDGPLLPGFTAALSVCQSGGEELEVFDLSKHGYDAVAVDFHPDGPRLQHAWSCEVCGGEECAVNLTLMYNCDDEDFRSLNLPLEDCFDWITIDLTCSACNAEALAFLDCECA